MHKEHQFDWAELPDHNGGIETYYLCEYCGKSPNEGLCITEKEYENKQKQIQNARKVVEDYFKKQRRIAEKYGKTS